MNKAALLLIPASRLLKYLGSNPNAQSPLVPPNYHCPLSSPLLPEECVCRMPPRSPTEAEEVCVLVCRLLPGLTEAGGVCGRWPTLSPTEASGEQAGHFYTHPLSIYSYLGRNVGPCKRTPSTTAVPCHIARWDNLADTPCPPGSPGISDCIFRQ